MQRASASVRGVDFSFEIGTEYRDPATGESWIDFPTAGAAAWVHRSANGHPFGPRAQRELDAGRVQRALTVGALCSSKDGVWQVLTDWSRSSLYSRTHQDVALDTASLVALVPMS